MVAMRSSHALAPRLIGRQAQLQMHDEHLQRARTGAGQVVLLAGEAGVGKTRLTRAFLERARATSGVEILQGYCAEERPAVPYGPFIGALRSFVRGAGATTLLQAAGPLGGDLLLLLPELGSAARVPGAAADPQSQKQRLFEAIYRAIRPVAAGRCRVVVLEDLHWADQTSLELLHYLAGAGERDALLLLGTYRADEPATYNLEWYPPKHSTWKRALVLSLVTLCVALVALGAYSAWMVNPLV
jgi:predicted ATPase